MTRALIITAAGASRRFGTPKLFERINGKTVLTHTIEALQHVAFDHIVISINADLIEEYKACVAPFPTIQLVDGGDTRQASVRLAFEALPKVDYVFIHDAARPNIKPAVLDRLVFATKTYNAVVPGVPVVDTLKQVEGNTIVKTVDRSSLVRIQTPQVFAYDVLLKAYELCNNTEATDESMLVEALGEQVHVVEGDVDNIKVTVPRDLDYCSWLLSRV